MNNPQPDPTPQGSEELIPTLGKYGDTELHMALAWRHNDLNTTTLKVFLRNREHQLIQADRKAYAEALIGKINGLKAYMVVGGDEYPVDESVDQALDQCTKIIRDSMEAA